MQITLEMAISVSNKIGIDFHGVITEAPEFFKKLIDEAIDKNIEVHIISGGPYAYIKQYLQKRQIKYSKLWCIYDYYKKKNAVEYFADGSFYIDSKLWNSAKAKYCAKEGINLHIDDSVIYGRCFQTPYCLYEREQKVCVIGNNKIDFSHNPQKSLAEILKLSKIIKSPEQTK